MFLSFVSIYLLSVLKLCQYGVDGFSVVVVVESCGKDLLYFHPTPDWSTMGTS